MQKFSRLFSIALLFAFSSVYAAHEHSYATGSKTNVQWLANELLGPGVAKTPYGALVGSTADTQVGWFSNLVSDVTSQFMTNGVILSNGKIEHGASITNFSNRGFFNVTENDEAINGSITGGPDYDVDLFNAFSDLICDYNPMADKNWLGDAAGLVFYVVPSNKTINIPYMMASAEFFYPFENETPANYNVPYDPESYAAYADKFAIFVRERTAEDGELTDSETDRGKVRDMKFNAAHNIARLPDGSMADISSANQYTNQECFVANVVTNGCTDADRDEYDLIFPTGEMPLPMEYNGAIISPTAICTNVVPGKTYIIKIVIADGNSYRARNSAIFLKNRAITSGADLKIDVSGPAFINEPGNVVFTNTVSNIGPATADGVVVTNYLPVGASYLECNTSGIGNVGDHSENGYLVWTLGDGFKSGSNAVMTVLCNLPETGAYTNSAVVVTSTGDYDESNNTGMCKTVVGSPKLPLTIKAITKKICYGEKVDLPALGFVESIDGTNGTQHVDGITVTFTNKQNEVSYPTNGVVDVGTYGIYLSNVSGIEPDDFSEIIYVPDELVVTQALLSITVTNVDWKVEEPRPAYGFESFEDQLRSTNTVADITGKDVVYSNRVWTAAKGDPTNADAKTYSDEIWLELNGEGAGNYAITVNPGALTVIAKKDPLDVYAISTNKVFGAVLPLAGLDYVKDIVGTNGTQHVTGIDVAFTNAVGQFVENITTAPVGTYGIVISNIQGVAESDFSSVTYHPGVLEVTKRAITITPVDMKKTYGLKLSPIARSGQFTISDADGNPFTPVSGTQITSVGLASEGAPAEAAYTLSGYDLLAVAPAKGSGIENYDIHYGTGVLYVVRKEITITANNMTNVYGGTLTFDGTEFSVAPLPLPNKEQIVSVTLTNVAETSTGVGTHPGKIVPSHVVTGRDGEKGSFSTNNYAITFVPGALTVTNRNITILAKDAEKMYGDSLAILGVPDDFIITNGTLAAGEEITSVHIDCEPAENPDTPARPHTGVIRPGHDVIGNDNFKTSNYAIAFLPGTLTVKKRAITITPVDTNKVYGAGLTFTGLPSEFEVDDPSKLWNTDRVERVTLESYGTNLLAKAGDHDILAKDARGPGVENYVISYGTGTLHVAQFRIEIKANDTNKVYGTGFELKGMTNEFTVTSAEPGESGLPNGEQVTHVTMLCELSADKDPKASFGTYLITPTNAVTGTGSNGFDTDNYEIAFTSGTLTVKKMPITIIANDVTNCYGDEVSFTGKEFSVAPPLPNEEMIETVTLTNLMPITTSVGTYTNAIKPWHAVTGSTGFATNNYEIAFSNGTLTVTQALLTVSVSNVTYRVGKPWNPPLAPSYGFSLQPKAGDTIKDVMGENVAYSNKVFNADEPKMERPEPYEDEIWIKLESITGERATNYVIRIDPGDLTVIHADPEFKTTITWKLNWNDGLLYADTITIKNVGDGEAEADYNYWVELPAGPATNGTRTAANPEHAFYLVSKDGTIPPEENDYKDLTEKVTNALMAAYGRVEFFPKDEVTLTGVGISVYSWDLSHPDDWFAGADEFFAKNFFIGKLYNPADTDKNFKVSEAEKAAAAPLLGESVSDYLEMTRLELLQYYHWNREKGTWTGPSK